jgi:hypothetical protein
MRNAPLETDPRVERALHNELNEADDLKIRRILAVVDGVLDPAPNRLLLDPLRARLAALKPARPVRFSRLLFIPLDPLIVPATDWKPGEPSIPRTALASIARVVRAGLNSETGFVDKAVHGHHTDATQAITIAGEALWPLAAEVLAVAPAPADWSETGLRASLYPPLAKAIAAVLRRAPLLRQLMLNGEVGTLKTDARAIDGILANIGNEPADACAMIARLILSQSPHAAPLWRKLVALIHEPNERRRLQEALADATEQVLATMERGVDDDIGRAPLAGVAAHVRRISSVLAEIEHAPVASRHQGRHLRLIREKLDQACRARFTEGINQDLLSRLAVPDGPVDAAGQTRFETSTRELRALEMASRKIGGAAIYDGLLRQALDSVVAATDAGTLTPVRKFRLIEILLGPEAAEALYRAEAAHRTE